MTLEHWEHLYGEVLREPPDAQAHCQQYVTYRGPIWTAEEYGCNNCGKPRDKHP